MQLAWAGDRDTKAMTTPNVAVDFVIILPSVNFSCQRDDHTACPRLSAIELRMANCAAYDFVPRSPSRYNEAIIDFGNGQHDPK
jgi:hypothetical protein